MAEHGLLYSSKGMGGARAWPGNANIEQILSMIRFLPGYEEAVRARQEAVMEEWCLEFL